MTCSSEQHLQGKDDCAAPIPTDCATSERMRRQRRRDTVPETLLRRELHRRGLRYFVDRASIIPRRRHDVVFPTERVAVDVHGCFWHSCSQHGTMPHANARWWADKLRVNRKRDADTGRRLEAAGWIRVVVWEHEDPSDAADRVERAVRSRRR